MNYLALLRIVSSWNIKYKPEYRAFRCAICQKYIRKAWFYYVISKEYICPVHLCKSCQRKPKANKLKFSDESVLQKRNTISLFPTANKTTKEIILSWKTSKPKYKIFFCDNCHKNVFKAYHVWNRIKNTLIETHFCRICFKKVKKN